mmetsp:Transcript_15663/g.36964  ORF Transcript_15663/g.36964 Transcript_15663/m.36964 type:complete len:587 (+) Transcript_15663:60-1820(+)
MARKFSEKLKRQLTDWDKGTRWEREKILREFVDHSRNRTEPELEENYGNGASLFLARVAAWLKLTYKLGYSVELQLEAVCVFVSASSGHRFMLEFLEVDGLSTLLEILKTHKLKKEAKQLGLVLLMRVANAGKNFLSQIFEMGGATTVCELAASTTDEQLHEQIRDILLSLGRSNPEHVNALQDAVIPLLTHEQPRVRRTAAQALRLLLAPRIVEGVSGITPRRELVSAIVVLMGGSNIHVQYDGLELARAAALYEDMRIPLMETIVDLLHPPRPPPPSTPPTTDGLGDDDDGTQKRYGLKHESVVERLQANAARLLGMLVDTEVTCKHFAELSVAHGVTLGLLITAASLHKDSNKYANGTLQSLTTVVPATLQEMRRLIGDTFTDRWLADPVSSANVLTHDYLNRLLQDAGQNFRYEVGVSPKVIVPGASGDTSTLSAQPHGGLEAEPTFTPAPAPAPVAEEDGQEIWEDKWADVCEADPMEGLEHHDMIPILEPSRTCTPMSPNRTPKSRGSRPVDEAMFFPPGSRPESVSNDSVGSVEPPGGKWGPEGKQAPGSPGAAKAKMMEERSSSPTRATRKPTASPAG